jgi:hypothetical protein
MRVNLANLANLANVGGRDASFDDDVQAKRLWRRHPLRLSRRASPSDPPHSCFTVPPFCDRHRRADGLTVMLVDHPRRQWGVAVRFSRF